MGGNGGVGEGECGPRLEIPGNNLYTVAYSRRNTRHNRNMGGGWGGEKGGGGG